MEIERIDGEQIQTEDVVDYSMPVQQEMVERSGKANSNTLV